jgi:alkylation response protein AidB-like acyl-CoA dehydrogenase
MKATLVDGGMVVSGRGRWSNDCEHAEWAMVGAKVPDVSDKQFPERNYRSFLFMVHRSEYGIDDTWRASCMAGSGSHDLVFDNVFVPTRRAEEVIAMNFNRGRGAGSVDNWISRIPFSLLFSIFFPAVALGCADGMIEEYVTRQRSRKTVMTGAPGILNSASHMWLAESVHEPVADRLLPPASRLHAGVRLVRRTPHRAEVQRDVAPSSVHHKPGSPHRRAPLRGCGSERHPHLESDAAVLARCARGRLHFGQDYDTSRLLHGRYLMGLSPTPDL